MRAAARGGPRGVHQRGIGGGHRGDPRSDGLRKARAVRHLLRHQGGARVRRTLPRTRGSAGARLGGAPRRPRTVLALLDPGAATSARRALLGRGVRPHHRQPARRHRHAGGPAAQASAQRLGVRRVGAPPRRHDGRGRPLQRPAGRRSQPGAARAVARRGAVGTARRPRPAAAPEGALGRADPQRAAAAEGLAGRTGSRRRRRQRAVPRHLLRREALPVAALRRARHPRSRSARRAARAAEHRLLSVRRRHRVGGQPRPRCAWTGPTPPPPRPPRARCRTCRR